MIHQCPINTLASTPPVCVCTVCVYCVCTVCVLCVYCVVLCVYCVCMSKCSNHVSQVQVTMGEDTMLVCDLEIDNLEGDDWEVSWWVHLQMRDPFSYFNKFGSAMHGRVFSLRSQ